jgi:hypothetical protein
MALYMAVIGTALVVSLLGLAGLTVLRIERQQASQSFDLLEARALAKAAVEIGLNRVNNDANWRTTYTNGVETAPQVVSSNGSGTVSWILEDTDGSLTDADTEVRLRGVGRVGDTVQVSSVKLISGGLPLSCLEVAVCSNGPITFWSSSTITTNQTILSNASVETNSGTTVNSDVEAVGSITGPGYLGTTTTPVPARTLPTASVFDYYIATGTYINFTAIPKIQGKRTIADVVLSPANNHYGATDQEGIYIIDCGGATIQIRDSRIIATLVLINPGSSSKIEGEHSWEPAVGNYPAVLVQGAHINLSVGDNPLDEAIRGVNFNPPGSPYQGLADSDQTDSYPSLIKGLVYASGGITIEAFHPHIDGVLITGGELKVNSSESLTVTYDLQFFSNPPPGFSSFSSGLSQSTLVPGSWLWDAAP